MFKAHVLHLLRRYLGEYVHGLSAEALRISVWKGDVVLKDLKLKAEALNALKLPVTVRAGFVGTVTLKVPWKSLGKEPVIVLIDRVFVLAQPVPDGRTLKEEDREKLFETKLQQIEETEFATLEAISKSKLGSASTGNSWLGSLIATIIGNLKISFSNVHIRYEDTISNPGHPFCSGVTLAKLAAVTMDEQGKETFDTSGALDKLRKSLQLERLAMYHDSSSLPWAIDKRWEDLTPKEWIQIFEDGINEPSSNCDVLSKWAVNRNYLVSPINGNLKYHRLGNQERNNPELPFEKASVVLSNVDITITETQYHDWIKLFEVISRYKTYIEVSHLRPVVPVLGASYLWWRYAAQASLQQKKMCYRFSWDRIQQLCQLRRRYIQLYAGSLQRLSNINNAEIREIEKDLDSKVILLWRLLAHAKLESVKSKEAAEQRRLKKRSWFPLRWGTNTDDVSADDSSEGSQIAEELLTREEWQAVNKLLSFQPDELTSHSGKDLHNMIQFLVTLTVGKAAARIVNVNQTEIVCGRFEQLCVSTKFKQRSTECDVLLKYYGLSAPEGSLAQSVCSEQKVNALAASFVRSPVGENVDWRLSATISPCYVTILMESFDRFLEFVKRSNAVSPTVAFETATALQMKIEKVTRRAQEQIQLVLEEQSRFALDIDFDAPKVRMPIKTCGSSKCDSHFLLDFGHFTLHTKESQFDEQRQNAYSRFYISGRDIAALFTDCGSEGQSCNVVVSDDNDSTRISSGAKDDDRVYSLVDRCGIAVRVDQVKVPHPKYPSTCISIQMPNLSIHFSPARYRRIMELLNILNGTMKTYGQPSVQNFQADFAPWGPPDFSVDARILVWRGIGNSVATWHPCFLVLSGLYLYLLECAKSPSYQRYISMAGKQVHEVPPTNVGGSILCIAVSSRGLDIYQALESSGTWVLQFKNEEEKAIWLKALVLATYQASVPPSVDTLRKKNLESYEYVEAEDTSLKTANLVINGALMEGRLFIYGKTGDQNKKLSEILILEVLATGGKVHTIHCDSDLIIKMKLHSLKIKDELQGCISKSSPYLACSVLQNSKVSASSLTSDSIKKEMSSMVPEDEDTFIDAFPDFLSLAEGGTCIQNMSIAKDGIFSDISDATGSEYADALSHEIDFGRGKGNLGEIFYEAEGSDDSYFVSITFLSRTPDSSAYDGIDTQLNVRMSKLEFYCNRPTLVALIDFGLDLNSVNNVANCTDLPKTMEDKSPLKEEKNEEKGSIRGLLGYGKVRVVFYLNMNVDSVSVFLNNQDGSQLAMLVQESFLLDLKVHPSSLSVEGMLGNFRLCDLSLETDHCWSWLCDLRNPGVDSLIKFKFDSFSSEDDDYEGYDYSLSGRLSAVRIVFLYRFVQEIMVYFMELATPHPEEAIKLVDKVGGFEWLVQKYEMDGAAALKLDLSLDTPIIIVPRNSTSKDFIQLDLGQLQVKNEFSWHGCPQKDASAVHLDILCAEILGINMSVGINGSLGKPMIQKGHGIEVFVRRSLRDVFRKVPTFSIEVKVGLLHGVMSDKEYKVILDCAYMNLNEEARLPPSFRDSKAGRSDTMRLLVDKVNMSSQILLSRTVTIVTVAVNDVLLELCTGIQEDSPLALISVEGLWVSYRMTSLSETDLYVTIPKFSVVDIRPDTNAEMRLMLGSLADTCKRTCIGNFPLLNNDLYQRTKSESSLDMDLPISTMFLMDYRWRSLSQSYVIRIQQPRVLVVPDFLLAVVEFFVPAFGTITGREETMDPRNDPICRNNNIVLTEPVYKQSEDVVELSSCRQLVADSVGTDDYIYDGGGKVIYLREEIYGKEFHSLSFRPLIIIGRGKRLRIINVKIENGSLLRKCVYLSNDSCFSVSPEDGVDVVLFETSSTDDNKKSMGSIYEASNSSSSSYLDSNLHMKQSFTFEIQVVSPEFTFYDDTKSSLIESLHGERLLRAKLDISFMYASKENDTWIRAIVKDFNVEAGSGLVILDPVDIFGGYTSMKDKTNLSIVSTDICIHLSLSAISLILNLESQVAGALEFGNAIPLVACTNFNRIWVSPKENGSYPYLSFWRPRPPPNYVVLGDCVTSRPVPPSQVVMAVSNTYGRVRKPVGFNLIGLFPGIQGSGVDVGKFDVDRGCSLWQPVAPSGYVALGCIAHIGNQPPPNHIVYCIRSDLLTSTVYSDCIFNAPSNQFYVSGFSIWRLENVFGSFTAHSSPDYPAKSNAFDLNYLLWNSNLHQSSSKDSNLIARKESPSEHKSDCAQKSSGWDILRSISKGSNCYVSTPNFERIWWDKGNDLRRPVSIWRPIARPGYVVLGDCITEGLEPPAVGILFKDDNPDVSAKPVQFTKVAHIVGRGFDEAFFWYPTAPPGYASLGCVVTKTGEVPCVDSFCCPRIDIVSQASIIEMPMSRSSNARASQSWSIWKVDNQACTFLARGDLTKPSNKLAYTFADSVKPKTRENITAELKFRCFSLNVLDSLCGQMTPIFNTTITNVKLATQGRLEAMNAVLVSSIAASTFNTQLEEWEPLVEPFDGIFKFETYDTNMHPPSKLGKRFHITATSILNVNISAANIETLVGSITSWRRHVELDHKANKLNEGLSACEGGSTFSPLDVDELQTVIIDNKLGCDIYLKKVESNSDTVDCLHHGDCASVWIPPPMFSYSSSVADESREARFYVAIQIIEAKGLPIINDGNSHNFFCALRLVIESEVTDQQKLFPQSARTKCVNPLISKINDLNEGTAKWNELFIFELSRKAPSKLEVEVTNLAAKAGKGEVVGAFSLSVGPASNELKKVASVRMVHQMYDANNIVSYPLRRTVQQNYLEEMFDYGSVMVSTCYFERKPVVNVQRYVESDIINDRDIGFWIGLDPEGEWHSIRSLLPLTVVPKFLEKDHIAMEVVVKNGKKRVTFRGLAIIINDSDVKLNISICPLSFIRSLESSTGRAALGTVVEEIFENQCYGPTLGWSSNHNAIAQWSTRDLSYTSKDFFEPHLSSGWRWVSTWSVEKSQFVDNEGWAYGSDLNSVMWPLTSSKSCRKSTSDIVRRRRWTRARQQLSELDVTTMQSDLSTVGPGCSSILPWKCTSKYSDQGLLVRPFVDHTISSYTWGRSVVIGSVYACEKNQAFIDQGSLGRQGVSKHADKVQNLAFKLNQLEKKDILLCCYSGSKQFWLSMGTDASVLHTELNVPVYDWRISVNSPIKLENRLPCPAEFTIWEKTKDGSCIQRQHGLISSRQSVHIYSADIQKQIYLTLFVQGGWRLEKDAVLVLDPLLSDHVSSFWMVHQKNKRRLRVSIERDMGGTSAAPKTIRFFVPYWIMNDTSLSLAYRVVEVEPYESENSESLILPRAVKSAKITLRNPGIQMDRRVSSLRRNIQVLEVIEDTSPVPSMLSPQDYVSRGGAMLFTSQKDAYRRVGITVASQHSEIYSPGISLLELENKERVVVKAFRSDGSYYKLSALLNMTSDRTKVIHFQPHTLFINRVGYSLCLQQCESSLLTWLHPTDPPKHFEWQSSTNVELLKLRVDGYEWSTPFSVCSEGAMQIFLNKNSGNDSLQLRVDVRSGAKSSHNEVIFRPHSRSSPYRIENRSMILPIRFRQVDDTSDTWKFLPPNAALSFLWEDLGRRHMLEILVDGTDPFNSDKYNIDEIFDHQPIATAGGPTKPLRISIIKEEKMNIVKISDWIPNDEPTEFLSSRYLQTLSPLSRDVGRMKESSASSDCEFHVILELPELGLSLIDHTPEEILYLSVQSPFLAYSTGLGSGISRFKLRMSGIQVDNQLPLSPMPVLFRPQRYGEETDFVLKFSMTNQSNGSLDLRVYPYIGFQGPENSAFLINIHEPIIWRLHEMIQQVNLSRLRESQSTSVSMDPIIQIGVLNISEVRFKVSMAMSPSQRPRGVLGFWSSLMTALGNTENMPIRINQKFHESICMRQSSMISISISNIQKDILSQPLQLLSGVDILGNASSALGHMSKGVAALSMDKKFIQGRQRQENKGIEDLGDIIREGGGALAKGLFRGVTGILTKPLEGAKSSGVEGFVQGVGKGIIGAAAQPVSGVLDLLSKTTEGANAMRMKIASAITSDEQLLRRRLPRVISGDNLLRPYNDFKAQGQVILQLAESGSFFVQVDLFKVRGKFALSDAYENHFLLPKGKIIMITHRRVLLLQQPSAIIAQRKFSPSKDPCSVLWDVSWGDLMTMELTHGKKDQPKAPPSQLILYLQTRSAEWKDQVRIIKCSRDTRQALEVYSSIDQAMKTYGHNVSKEMHKRKVGKPYSPIMDGGDGDVLHPREQPSVWSPQQVPASVPLSSTFGSGSGSAV